MARKGGRRPAIVALLLVAVPAVALALGELALRAAPRLLPAWYRERFPLHGVEFFRPGVLDHTPIDELPLPIRIDSYDGPPPADLKDLGLVPPDEDSDRRRFPSARLAVDSLGLPNERTLERADVLIVGDSFAVSAGVAQPPGLQRRLEQATGLTFYNLGVAAIGPFTEDWLLRE